MLRSECTQMVTKVGLGALSGRGGAEVDSLAGTIIIVKSRGAASRPHEDLEATRRAKRWSAASAWNGRAFGGRISRI